ncbi:MAG: hypothetical protein RL380_994 [Verrucomicrobiota bacterium]
MSKAIALTKKLCALAALFTLLPAAHALSLPFYEAFTYPIGNLLGTNDSATTWNIGDSTGTGSAATYPISGLAYTGLQTSNGSSGLIVPAIATGKNRRVGAPISPAVTGGPLYSSFLLNVQTLPTGDNLIAAMSSVATGSPGSSANGIWLNSAGQLLISVNSSAAPSAAGNTTALGTNTTHLVVARYSTVSKSLALWLDPATNTFGAAESSLPTPQLNFTNSSGKTSMGSFWVNHQYTYPQNVFIIDELRLASTWAEVTPSAAAPAAAVATSLSFVKNPGYAATSASVGSVEIQVLDQFGKPFAANAVPIAVALIGNGTLAGTSLTQNTDATGKATFSGLTVSAAGVKQLTASRTGLTSSTSDYFSILSGSGGSSVPVVTSATQTGGNLVLHGTSGPASAAYDIITTTNLSTPKTNWSLLGSSTFQANGNFDFTNTVGTGRKFYALRHNVSGGGSVTLPTFEKMGWANTSNVTGGAGGATVTVTNYPDFTAYLSYPAPLTIRVLGKLTDPAAGVTGNNYALCEAPNKTILGVGTNATLEAVDLRLNATNIIVRNIYFDVLPGGTNDSITIDGGSSGTGGYTWIDHCRFYNAQDGSVDVTKGADYVTVSWCQFAYSVVGNTRPYHRLVNLIGSSDTDNLVNFHVSLHHNWYSTNCMERMPSVRFGRVHVFNNYYACPSNDYCVRTRLYAQTLVENNYFDHINNALEKYINNDTAKEPLANHGLLKATGNIFDNCTTNYNYILLNDASHDNPGTLISSNSTAITFNQGGSYTIVNVDPFNDTLSDMNPPPYTYTLDPTASIPNTVTNFSGPGVLLPLP